MSNIDQSVHTSGSSVISVHNVDSESLVWNGTCSANAMGGTFSSNSVNGSLGVNIKRCRECNHAHLDSQYGCMDASGMTITFVSWCTCKEYVPTDKLEYIEYLYDKTQKGLKK